VTASELSSRGGIARGHGTRGSTGTHLSREVRSETAGHVAAPERTSGGRCGPKLQLKWQRVDVRPTTYLDLEFICEVPDLQGAIWLNFSCTSTLFL
jgi:hypothetical protein